MAKIFRHETGLLVILTLLGVCWSQASLAQDMTGWLDSRQFLNSASLPPTNQGFIFTRPIYTALKQSLLNPEQHRQLLDLQVRTGTKPQNVRPSSVSVDRLTVNQTTAKPKDILLSVSSFAGKEVKSAVLPEPLRKGMSFEFGRNEPKLQPNVGKPVRYGLLVTNVEPSSETLRLAALPHTELGDYALVEHAPKAKVTYAVGPLPHELEIADSASPTAAQASSHWTHRLPDFQFRGKIVPRGAPTSKEILPPQSFILEQSQNYYSLELQTSKLAKKDALFHRFRLPLAGAMSIREERNEKLQRTRSTLENIYAKGPLAMDIDYFTLEKRYQTGLIYQKSTTRIEFYDHLPENPSVQGVRWKTHRFELKVQTAF